MFYGHCRPMARTPIRLPFFHGGRSNFQQREVVLPGWGGPKSDDVQGVSRTRGPLPFGGTGKNHRLHWSACSFGEVSATSNDGRQWPTPDEVLASAEESFHQAVIRSKSMFQFQLFPAAPKLFPHLSSVTVILWIMPKKIQNKHRVWRGFQSSNY